MIKQLHDLFKLNSPEHLIIAGIIALTLFSVLTGIRHLICRRLICRPPEKTAASNSIWSEAATDFLSSTSSLMLLAFSILMGLLALDMPDNMHSTLIHLAIITLIMQGGLWGGSIIRQWAKIRISKDHANGIANTNYEIISHALRLILWSLILLLILSNLGINVTTLIASLGIGGVAVALALQNILGDLFSSLSIVMDKPFETGDFLTIGDLSGTVKHIGLKTTRLTSLTGEELVFTNSNLLKNSIHNYKKMRERRIVYTLGVEFATPLEKLRRISDIVRDIFSGIPHARLDRVHFSNINQSTLDFEIAYYVRGSDYNTYMDVQQAFNFAIIEQFTKEGIQFAYPTQTLQIQNAPNASLQPPFAAGEPPGP